MEDDSNRYNASGRRSGNEPAPKEIKHTVKDSDRGIKFEVYSVTKLTPDQVSAEIKKWLVGRKMSDLTPWRTYRIQVEEPEE